MLRHITMKLLNTGDKEKILKADREQKRTQNGSIRQKGKMIRVTTEFSENSANQWSNCKNCKEKQTSVIINGFQYLLSILIQTQRIVLVDIYRILNRISIQFKCIENIYQNRTYSGPQNKSQYIQKIIWKIPQICRYKIAVF